MHNTNGFKSHFNALNQQYPKTKGRISRVIMDHHPAILESQHHEAMGWLDSSQGIHDIAQYFCVHAWDCLGHRVGKNHRHILDVHDLEIALNREWNTVTIP